jgi:peptide/nickel transport system substrate-binding protein
MKRLLIGLVIGAAAFVPAAVTGASQASGAPAKVNRDATITYSGPSIVGTQLDPAREVNSSDIPATALIYDRLWQIDKDKKLQPMIATKGVFSPDNMQYTVTIRSDVVFHDGTKLDATAVKKSIDRAKAINGPVVGILLSPLTSVDVVDPTTVRFNLNRPAGDFPFALGRSAGAIVNPKAIDANMNLTNGDANMAGSGPYVVGPGGFTPITQIDLVRASTPYWDPKAGNFKDIKIIVINDDITRLNAYQSGQVDAAQVAIAQFDPASQVSGHHLYKLPTGAINAFMMRVGRGGPLDNVAVRQAVATAIDRNAIANGLLSGLCVPTYQNYLPGDAAYSPNLKDAYKFNLAKAKKMLADAGYPNGIDISMVLGAGTEPVYSMGQAIQAQLARANIRVNVTVETPSQGFADFAAGKFDSYTQNNVGQSTQALYLGRYIQRPGQTYQLAAGPPADQLNQLVNKVNDPAIKPADLTTTWYDINKLIMDQAWIVPICSALQGYAVPNDTVGIPTMAWRWGNIFDLRYVYRTSKS